MKLKKYDKRDNMDASERHCGLSTILSPKYHIMQAAILESLATKPVILDRDLGQMGTSPIQQY